MSGAIGYARVSTEEQQRDNNSIPVQKNRIVAYCQQHDIPLLKVFEVSESAWTEKRTSFEEVLSYCRKESNKVSHLIVTDLSRLARKVDVQVGFLATLDALGIKFVSLDEPLTDNTANGNFMRNITGCVNQLFSDTLSERTRQRMRVAVLEGRYLWPAPTGYVNRNKNIEPDPIRAPLVRQAFELVASGRFVTTKRVLNFLTSMGLTTKKGRPIQPQTFSRMLKNETYAGWIIMGELRVRGTYEPIVPDEVFAAVQMKLNKKGVTHKKLNEDFPLRGIARCLKCERPLTAGWVKGRNDRYPRYWCWTKGCGEIGVSRDELHGQFVGLLSLVEPTAELVAQLPERIANQWSERKERIAADAKRLSSKLAEIKTLNQKALTEKLQGKIKTEDYDDFTKANAEETFRIKNEINALDSERNTMEEMLKQAEVQAVDLVGAWEKGNVHQRQELAKSFFPDGLVFSQQRKFFEPRNTVITEMYMRFLQGLDNIGVPDGI